VVVLSVSAVVLVLAFLVGASFVWGFVAVFKLYLFPYLVNNAWFIMYTFLHHTHINVPHYDAAEWSYLRGALTTIDRDYGIADHLHHRIGCTHVLHHLFKRIPHYHAEEASAAIRPILGRYHVQDNTHYLLGLWQSFCEVRPRACAVLASTELRVMMQCKFVDGSGILWYRKSVS
jgi:omega-6 fatty acid desaturase (delta-12 desaturase)